MRNLTISSLMVALLFLGCATNNKIQQKNNIKKGTDMEINIKTFEEYMKQRKFVLPIDEKIQRNIQDNTYLLDNTKIDYIIFAGADGYITENIFTLKHPFVQFKKTYYNDTKSLESISMYIGEYPIGKYQEFSKEGKLIKEEVYKQKSHLPYTTILQSLEKLGYLDLKNAKVLKGTNEKFELNYISKSDMIIENIRAEVPEELQSKFDKSQGVWWYTINIKQGHPIMQRRLVLDDIDGSLLYQYEYRIADASEME